MRFKIGDVVVANNGPLPINGFNGELVVEDVYIGNSGFECLRIRNPAGKSINGWFADRFEHVKENRLVTTTKSGVYQNAVKYPDANPLGQRISKPVHCGVCGKKYSGEQANFNTIVGGGAWFSPIPKIAEGCVFSECNPIGPCCVRKVDEFILQLKANPPKPIGQTCHTEHSSWMPYDIDGDL